MDKTVLQIPVSKNLRIKAENAALASGFSSLQEIIRVFMKKLSQRAIEVSFQEVVKLSPRAERRYQKMDKDFVIGKNVYSAKTIEELKTQLSR